MKKRLYLSILLFCIIMILLGLPYTNWGFKTDDFANLYHCFIKSYKDILKFFYEGDIENLGLASNQSGSSHFLKGLYRPMSFIYYLPQVALFGSNPYGYFLVTVILHAINSVILFNLFSTLIPISIAFLASLFFAFHPSLVWLGWASAQTYFTELITLIFIILSLKHYLDTKKFRFYLISCFLFLANIYLKEATIILPFWSIFAIYFYQKSQNKNFSLKNSISLSLGYWSIAAFYLTTRALVFGFNMTSTSSTTLTFSLNLDSFVSRQKERFFDFVTYISDMLSLRWLPQNNPLIKGSLIVLIIILISYLFYKNNKKSYILFLLFSTILFSWPAIIMHYQPRYIYMSIAFFIFALVFLIKYSKLPVILQRHSNIILLPLFLIVINNAFFLKNKLKEAETIRHSVMLSMQSLLQQEIVQNSIKNKNKLFFYNLPATHRIGIAPAMWMLSGKDNFEIYSSSQKPKIKNSNLLYVTWNYNQSKFEILNKS